MSEVRLIDANALVESMFEPNLWLDLGDQYNAFTLIDTAPTITPESLGWRKEVAGRWEQSNEFDEDANVYSCSACGEPWVLIDGTPKENNMSYCPNCGARMDGEP